LIDSGRCIVDAKWLFDRGDLHDAKVVKHLQTEKDVTIFIDDQWSNFEGLEEYPGAQSGALIVSGALNFPDFGPIAQELLTEVELSRTPEVVSLKFHTLGHPVIEVRGQEVFCNSAYSTSDKI
jgi:hypothetical protein